MVGYKAYCFWVLLLVRLNRAADSPKWVWAGGRRKLDDGYYPGPVNRDRKYTGELVTPRPLFRPFSGFAALAQSSNENLRYEVTEPNYLVENRPIGGYQPLPENIYRPQTGFPPARPIDSIRPIGPGFKPPPPSNNRPILTGPIPSWEQHNPNAYRDYDKCKCVHSFNCNTPGIKFGTCDVDKQYCCYRSNGNEISRPVHKKPRPVLAGPGGPIDAPNRPTMGVNTYGRPFRPFSEINGYIDSNGDLDEAYRRGLESAIHELYDKPREHQQGMYSSPGMRTGGFGLYQPQYRSAPTNITAI